MPQYNTSSFLKHCFIIVLAGHIHLNRWHTTSFVFSCPCCLGALHNTRCLWPQQRLFESLFIFQTVCAGYIRICFCCKGAYFESLVMYFVTMKTLFMWISCFKYFCVLLWKWYMRQHVEQDAYSQNTQLYSHCKKCCRRATYSSFEVWILYFS